MMIHNSPTPTPTPFSRKLRDCCSSAATLLGKPVTCLKNAISGFRNLDNCTKVATVTAVLGIAALAFSGIGSGVCFSNTVSCTDHTVDSIIALFPVGLVLSSFGLTFTRCCGLATGN